MKITPRVWLAVGAVGAVVVATAGCGSTTDTTDDRSQEAVERPAQTASIAPSADVPVPTEEVTMAGEVPVLLTFGSTAVRATLSDNAATSSLLAQLPLDLEFSDFGGQEKIASLPGPLSLQGMPAGSAAASGTVGYYAPAQALVLYYQDTSYYAGIVPLGTFDDVTTVRDSPAFTATLSVD